ncbi:uncharacterized protein LOC131657602 [Vicia villosa]|uniref:uncharacterized protein LOC131657602 n=1 Tax=Vicia villosa TaxID=3911 RepID=UPI00273CC456|nr:uncharacterized protein LOC131657602 [Vicia villosa]
MTVAWNVRGLNKMGKLREISSRLLQLHPTIAILLETRVKYDKSNKIREQLHLRGRFLDNYHDHANRENLDRLYEKDNIGDYFTWTNKHIVGTICSRIDHVLGNIDWLQTNIDVSLDILPPSVSDHCLLCLNDHTTHIRHKTHFTFTNSVVHVEGYHAAVYCSGKTDLLQAQDNLIVDRMNIDKIEKVKVCTEALIHWHELNVQILRQKAKIHWLREGDSNSAYFHASLKAKHQSTNLNILYKEDGTPIIQPEDIVQEMCKYYKNLMGTKENNIKVVDITAMRKGPQLSMTQRASLIAPITVEEIKKALRGIGDLKSPGVDGYGAKFFKTNWNLIEHDLIAVVEEFFGKNVMLRAFNETMVTLIPKHNAAKIIKEFRPIAGCSTFYKVISKILTTRLGGVLGTIIRKFQAAFVPGQKIHNHIFLAAELLKDYNRNNGTLRCMVQLDLQKAYDMVDWGSLESILQEVGLPRQFVSWIMTTVTTISYRFKINGAYTDRMEARRDIRQEDPLSPLLFVITMEYLNRLLVQMQENPNFNHHSKCERLQITNLTFADDFLLFARGDQGSVELMQQTLHIFLDSTGSNTTSWKSPVAWEKICKPKNKGDLSIVEMEMWNRIFLLKLLWNINAKMDSLWVRWIRSYYLKHDNVINRAIKPSDAGVFKAILQQRDLVQNVQTLWMTMLQDKKCNGRKIYNMLQGGISNGVWYNLVLDNKARPIAVFALWMLCHRKLPTRMRLHRWGMINITTCVFCDQEETIDHMFFDCVVLKRIWKAVLNWMGIHHDPGNLTYELNWLLLHYRGKGWRADPS